MLDIALDEMDRDSLLQLQKDVDKAIAEYETRRKDEARAALEATAEEYGFTLGDFTGEPPKKGGKRLVHPPKYRHPDNPKLTWSGRGRRPAWISEAVDGGQALEDFLIGKR